MEYLGIFGVIIVLNSPIYLMLFNIQRRLTKLEVNFNKKRKE